MIKQTLFTKLSLLILGLLSSYGHANLVDAHNMLAYQQTHIEQCGEQYFQQTLPNQLHDKNLDIFYLCFQGFAVGYSGVSKTALWSAEHLTRERIEQAQQLERVDNFHEESQLPDRVKAFLTDYKKVPYDRGHLAPNADMATLEQQYDSFSLANIIPQHPKHNRQVWRKIETNTRYLAIEHGEIYVITGTVFAKQPVQQLHQRIFIPSHLFKVIYIPHLNQASVYYTPNDDSQFVETISLQQLANIIHFDVMPTLPDIVKNSVVNLPLNHQSLDSQPTKAENIAFFTILNHLLTGIATWFDQLFSA